MLRGLRKRLRVPSAYEAVAVVLAISAIGGIAYASIPAATGEFTGCYATTNGLLLGIPHSKGDLRVVEAGESCRGYERRVSWNQQGEPGADGSDGVDGVSGYERVRAEKVARDDPFGDHLAVEAHCPAGKEPLGGGFFAQASHSSGGGPVPVKVFWSEPLEDAWSALVEFPFAPGPREFTRLVVTAVCADVA